MNSSKWYWLFALLFASHVAVAQDDSLQRSSHPTYFNQVLSGALFAKEPYGDALTATVVNGVRMGPFALGLSLGYSAYQIRPETFEMTRQWESVPVSVVVGMDLVKFRNRNAIHLQTAYGRTRVWAPDEEEDSWRYYDPGGGGAFYALAGYRIMADRWAMYVMAGYAVEQLNYLERYRNSPGRRDVERTMERFSIMIGFGMH